MAEDTIFMTNEDEIEYRWEGEMKGKGWRMNDEGERWRRMMKRGRSMCRKWLDRKLLSA